MTPPGGVPLVHHAIEFRRIRRDPINIHPREFLHSTKSIFQTLARTFFANLCPAPVREALLAGVKPFLDKAPVVGGKPDIESCLMFLKYSHTFNRTEVVKSLL